MSQRTNHLLRTRDSGWSVMSALRTSSRKATFIKEPAQADNVRQWERKQTPRNNPLKAPTVYCNDRAWNFSPFRWWWKRGQKPEQFPKKFDE
jgi:hypothetical protein